MNVGVLDQFHLHRARLKTLSCEYAVHLNISSSSRVPSLSIGQDGSRGTLSQEKC